MITVLLYLNSPPKITCPSGKLRTEFTSLTAKISSLFHFLCTLISTVPLKSKLTLEAWNSRFYPRISKLEHFEFWDARSESRDARIESRVLLIEDRGSKKLGFAKERCCTVTYPFRYSQSRSVLVVWCSVTVWIVGVWQAFNQYKSIFSFSKIYPACTVYVPFAPYVPRFSQMNGAARQFILWIKLVAVLCKSWWRLRHLSC